jgi:hypothetical protein
VRVGEREEPEVWGGGYREMNQRGFLERMSGDAKTRELRRVG